MPFGVNLVQWQDSGEVARRAYVSAGAFVEGLQPTVLWIGPGLVALGLAGLAVRSAQLARCWQFKHADLLIGLAILLVLGYVNKSAGWFPKYQVVLVPLLACLGAPLLAHGWCLRPRLTLAVALPAAVASAVVCQRLVRDDWALQRTYAIDATAATWLCAIVGVNVVLALRWRGVGLASLLGIAVGWSVATSLVQLQAPYSTTYWYGTSGTVEAAQWLDTNLQPAETYVAAKEVALRAANSRYVDQDNLVYLLGTGDNFDGTWAGVPIRTLLVWDREPYVHDLFRSRLSGYAEIGRFGDYVVYASR
jgi:hypothetical protein